MNKLSGRSLLFLTASSVFILDRLSKYIIIGRLMQGQSVAVLKNIFHITLVFNKGVAFGLLKEGRPLFIALSLFVIAIIILYVWKNAVKTSAIALPLGLILGGASGNLIDRIKWGYVIDFFDFRVWPVFNIADSALTIGTVILFYRILFDKCYASRPS